VRYTQSDVFYRGFTIKMPVLKRQFNRPKHKTK